MPKIRSNNKYSDCKVYDVYIEITIERRIKVSAIDYEEAIDLGMRRAKQRTTYLTNHNHKIVAFEAIDAVKREPTL